MKSLSFTSRIFWLGSSLLFVACHSKHLVEIPTSTSTAGSPVKASESVIVDANKSNVNTDVNTKDASMQFLNKARAADLDFNTFSAKGKAEIDFDGTRHSVSINIRIKKNQIIWAYANLGFIPLAKAYITPDSVRLQNMIGGGTTVKGFDYLRQFSSEAVDFSTLQSLLTGGTASNFFNDASIITPLGSGTRITANDNHLQAMLDFSQLLKPLELDLKQLDKKQDLHVSYAAHTEVGGKLVPQTVKMASHVGGKSYLLSLAYQKIGLNENLDFPFVGK